MTFVDRSGNEGDEMVGRKDKRFRNDGHLYGHYGLNKSFLKIKENFHLIDYNLYELSKIIDNNMIDKIDPKPLYINNYF